MRLGLLVILTGIIYLLKSTGLIDPTQLSILVPIIIIYIGVAMVARGRCWHCGVWHDHGDMGKKTHLCDCEDCSPSKKKSSK